MVRCWNCGTFMREELAARYAEMQREAADTSFRPLPEVESAGDARRAVPARPVRADDEGDFELAGGFADDATAAGDDDFSLTGEFPAAPPTDAEAPPKPDEPPEVPPGAAEEDSVAAEAPKAESPDDPAGAPGAPAGGPAPDVAHSEATGGEALLDIALADEARRGRRAPKGLRVTADHFLLRCPAGHPIKVARKHAGKIGRCPDPDCRLRYLVPDIPPDAPADGAAGPAVDAKADTDEQPTRDPLAAGSFPKWIDGPLLHEVDPAKLDKVKRAPGSLAKGGVPADLALSPDTLLVLILKGRAGLLGLGGEKPDAFCGRRPATTSTATPPASPTCRASTS